MHTAIVFWSVVYLVLLGLKIWSNEFDAKRSAQRRAMLRGKTYYAIAQNPARANGPYGWAIKIGMRKVGE